MRGLRCRRRRKWGFTLNHPSPPIPMKPQFVDIGFLTIFENDSVLTGFWEAAEKWPEINTQL